MRTNMEKVKSNLDKNKVLLGLSGGVDSTTAAFLLKEKGYDVTGYYFDITGKYRRLLQTVAATVSVYLPLILI